MVAAVQARSLIITVNGNDWSQNLVSFEIGFDSYAQGTGLILKKGTLTLCNTSEDNRPIDPIDQSDFDVGNVVEVDIDGVGPHPLGGRLRILAPPEVSPINSGIPEVEGNLVVSLPLGCELAFARTEQSDDDKTGVVLGSTLNTSDVAVNLLRAAGVFTSLPFGWYDVSFPYSKNGGGFVDLAGEFIYSSDTRPRFIYCNSNNNVLSQQVSFTAFPVQIILGENDRLYQRQLDLNGGAGEIFISGIKRNVVDKTEDYPYSEEVLTYTENTLESRTVSTFYFEETIAYPSPLGSFVFRWMAGIRYFVEFINIPIVGYDANFQRQQSYTPNVFGVATPTGESITYTARLFDNEQRLSVEVEATYISANTFYPEGWEDIFDPVEEKEELADVTNNQFRLVLSEVKITRYSFENETIIKQSFIHLQNLGLIDRNYDFRTEFRYIIGELEISGMINTLFLKEERILRWKTLQNGSVAYSENVRTSKMVNTPGLTLPIEERSVLESKATRQIARNISPPAITYWEGRYSVQEEPLSDVYVFGNGNNLKRQSMQMPFVFDESQLENFAKAEGKIINGRQYQYLIECDPDLFLTVTEPLEGVTVIEPTQKRYFLADALTWYHTATEAYVAFAGIFAGSSALEGTTPSSFPVQLIASPPPSGSIVTGGFSLIDTISGSADPNE